MTDITKDKSGTQKILTTAVSFTVLFILLLPSFLFPKEISKGVFDGMRLCVECVIPSLFPFFIIADAIVCFSEGIEETVLGKIFSRLFHLPSSALSTFICGITCGFPIGVKIASELYLKGEITKKDAEHMIGFSNNPSLAFVIGAVGVGMLGSLKVGVLLYFSVVFSSLSVAFLFRQKGRIMNKTNLISRQKFNLVDSIKNAGYTSVTVSSYIIFFSALLGLLKNISGGGIFSLVFSFILEVSGATVFISSADFLNKSASLSLIAAALAFSGFSVHMQARSIAPKEISFIKYYLMKTVQAVLAALIVLAILPTLM